MKDFIGRELSIGDEVGIVEPFLRNMVKATIIEFTPKMARVEYISYLKKKEVVLRDSSYITKL